MKKIAIVLAVLLGSLTAQIVGTSTKYYIENIGFITFSVDSLTVDSVAFLSGGYLLDDQTTLNLRTDALHAPYYWFDQIDDEVTVTDNAIMDDLFDDGGTFEAFVYPISDGESSAGRIVDKAKWYLALQNEATDSAEVLFFYDFSTTNGQWSTTSLDLAMDVWSHIAVVYDNGAVANDPVIYINGVSKTLTEDATPVGTRTTDNGSDLILGADGAGGNTFDGLFSMARVHNDDYTLIEIKAHQMNSIPYQYQDADQTDQTSGTLTIGKKYRITSYLGSDDFSNVGDVTAPKGATGDEFTATGTTPTVWASSSVLDNIGIVLEYDASSMSGATWYDKQNSLNGTVSGAIMENEQAALILRSSNATLTFKDLDATDSDVNASIDMNLTDAGTGAEDADVALKVQRAGTLRNVFEIDADLEIVLNEDAQDLNLRYETSNSASYLAMDGGTDITTLTSGVTNMPTMRMMNTTDDATAPILEFQSDRATPVDADVAGTIYFEASDDGGTQTDVAQIIGSMEEIANGDEAGRLQINIMHDDGSPSLNNWFDLVGDNGTPGQGYIEINASQDDVDFEINTSSQSAFNVTGSDGKAAFTPSTGASGSSNSFVTITATTPAHGASTPTDIWLDINPTIGINTVATTANIIDLTFTSPAYATAITSTAQGIYVAPTFGAASLGTNTVTGVRIDPSVGAATAGTNQFTFVGIDAYTGDAQINVTGVDIGNSDGLGTARGVSIGTTWDADLYFTESGGSIVSSATSMEFSLPTDGDDFIFNEAGTDFWTIDRTASVLETDATSATGFQFDIDDVNTGDGVFIDSDNNALSTGSALKIEVVSSALNAGMAAEIVVSGAMGASNTAYGLHSTLTTAAATNVAGYFNASGATANYALQITGDVNSLAATDWDLLDNVASSLSFDAAGAAGLLNFVTTDNGEGIGFTSPATGTTDMYTFTGSGNFADGNVVKITDSGTPTDGTLLKVLSVNANPDAIVAGGATNFTTIASDGSIDNATATAATYTTTAGGFTFDAADASAGTGQSYITVSGTTPAHTGTPADDIFLDINPTIGLSSVAQNTNIIDITFASPAWDQAVAQNLRGLLLTYTTGAATAGTNTVNFIETANYTGDAQINVNALKIGTSDGLGTARAIEVNSGWDADIYFAESAGYIASSGTQVALYGGNTTGDDIILDVGGDTYPTFTMSGNSTVEVQLPSGSGFVLDENATDFVTIDRTATTVESDAATTTAWQFDFDDVSTGIGMDIQSDNNALTSGSLVKMQVASTAINAGKVLEIALSGAVGANTAYGISNTLTTTATTNYGFYADVTGGTTDYAYYGAGGQMYSLEEFGIATTTPDGELEIIDEASEANAIITVYHDTEATTARLSLRKAENTEASHGTPIDDNAVEGTVSFYGYDTDEFIEGARIQAIVDGTPADNSVPTDLEFYTTATNTPTLAMTINSDQTVTFAGAIGMESIVITPTSTGTKLDFELETEWTTGTLINADYGGSTTLSGAVVGQYFDFNTNVVATSEQSVKGFDVLLPVMTVDNASPTVEGIEISGGAITQTTGGTTTWNGADITMPDITQTAGAIVSTGLKITDGTVTTGGTQYGIDISAGTGTGTTNAIRIGASWDLGINDASGITTTGAFTSLGIDDNASTTALTISVDEDVSIGAGGLTVTELTGTALSIIMEADASEDNADTWKFLIADGDQFDLQTFQSGAYVSVMTAVGATGAVDIVGASTAASYASDAQVTATTYLATGADPADAGALRLSNAEVIGWEDGTEATLTHTDDVGLVFNLSFQAEHLISTDDADVNDNLTVGDVIVDAAAGQIDGSGATSLTISTSSAGADLIFDAADAAAGTAQSYITISGTTPAHNAGTPTDIWLDVNPTIGIPTVATNSHIMDLTFSSPAYATAVASNVRGIYFAPTIGNATLGTNAVAVLDVAAITGDAQVSLYGLRFGALTGTAATENAIDIGTGWDAALEMATGNAISWNATDKLTHSANTMTISGFTTWDFGTAVAVDFNSAPTFTANNGLFLFTSTAGLQANIVGIGTAPVAGNHLELPTAGVISWNNTDKLTHSANTMTLSGFTTWDFGAAATVDFNAAAISFTGGNSYMFGNTAEVTGDNANAAFTMLTLLNSDEHADTETGQTVDLVFEVQDKIGAAAYSDHEAAKISAYKIADFFAADETSNDAGLKFSTVTDGAYVLNTTMSDDDLATVGNLSAATYGSDGSISDAELLTLDDGLLTQILVGGGAGVQPVWTTATGTGAPVRAGSPTFTTQITTPIVDNGATGVIISDVLGIDTAPNSNIGISSSRTFTAVDAASTYGINWTDTIQLPTTANVVAGQRMAYGTMTNVNSANALPGVVQLNLESWDIVLAAGTRTISILSNLYVGDAPTTSGGGTTTVTNGPYAIFVDAGESRFDGEILAEGGIDTESGSLVLASENTTGLTIENDGDVLFGKAAHFQTATQSAVGPTDNVDAGDINVLFVNTSGNNVTIGGFVNGVSGQVLQVVIIDATNNTVLENAEATGNQDIYLDTAGDETQAASYGGWTLVCNGTHWYEVDH